MRVSCSKDDLHRALSIAGRAVATKSTLPILGNYLIEAGPDALIISATNLDLGIAVVVPAMIAEPGRVTIQARILSEFVASLNSGSVELSQDQGPLTVSVRQGSAQAHIRGTDPDDFPTVHRSVEQGALLRLDPAIFRDAISHVAFAAATDDSRPVLAGVQLAASGDRAKLSAADGFRMSMQSADLAEPINDNVSIIIPARSLQEISRILPDAQGDIEMTVTPTGSQLLVALDGVWLTTRLIDGTFPDLSQIVPKEWSTRTTVSREDMLDAAKRAAIFARSGNDVVKLEIAPASDSYGMGRIRVSGTAADTGDNLDDVDAQVEGDEIQIAFNGRYLTDVLSVLRSADVVFELHGANSAGVVKSADSDEFVHVIMPMVIGQS